MTKIRKQLAEILRNELGEATDPAVVLDQLCKNGALDDVLCRRYVIRKEFSVRYSSSTQSARSIQEDLAFEHGLTRRGVLHIIGGK